MDWQLIGWGTFAGLTTGLATFVGATPAFFGSVSGKERQNIMLGFAAGVMLSASYLSLIVPAAAFAQDQGYSAFAAAAQVALAVLVGAACLDLLRRSERVQSIGGAEASEAARRVWLLLIAMTAHNLPEGAAVGVSFAAGDPRIAIGTAVGIGVQNLPEGLAVAAALLTIGYSRGRAVLIGGATGLVEPVGAFLGVTLVSAATWLLPAGMGWAAGAMIYIVAAELIPAIHQEDGHRRPIWAFLIGVCAMLFLDIALAA
ncbi:ZIP family metal transporter [Sphingomonas sabuli]|uniref:ZIP family metal transporter n=1 Tax=Sphingomonas sabuli TaxID=2764186 RepID=A0A7G9L074_9SPHN|nr:ZIP family metal transporter [Sphingomonas sabuli]QNM82023.1 ZIP family metal transporter [Sphingomonas sabuli]